MATSLHDVLDGRPVAMVTTLVGRQLSARPVVVAEIDRSCLTFLGHRDEEWVKHVEGREALVHVTFADAPGGCWVSLDGAVATSHDPAAVRRLWRAELHGPFFAADDPDVVVLRFEVIDGEFWSEAGRRPTALDLSRAPLTDRSRVAE